MRCDRTGTLRSQMSVSYSDLQLMKLCQLDQLCRGLGRDSNQSP